MPPELFEIWQNMAFTPLEDNVNDLVNHANTLSVGVRAFVDHNYELCIPAHVVELFHEVLDENQKLRAINVLKNNITQCRKCFKLLHKKNIVRAVNRLLSDFIHTVNNALISDIFDE